MDRKFDLIVLGTGEAGAAAAHKCRRAGWSVGIVDCLAYGGTCALRGCDPKKVLVGIAELTDWSHRMQGKGITEQSLAINWSQLIKFKRTFTDPVPLNSQASFEKAGILTYHGQATFTGRNSLVVGEQTLTGRFILIATGATPALLNIVGENLLTTSDEFLELEQLPGRILFVGGGYIAFEFTHIAARAGAAVTVLHRGERPLEGFDADLVDLLLQATRQLGVQVQLKTAVTAVEQVGGKLLVKAHSSETQEGEQSFEADLVVHAAGRIPALEGLNLKKAAVEWSEKGVTVNQYLQSTSNPAVYAAGDAAAIPGGLPLTPNAGMAGNLAASNMLKGNHAQPDFKGVPTVTFTTPPLAAVGLREAEAYKHGYKFKTKTQDTSDWYSSRRVNLKPSAFKVLIEEGSGRILGAHLLGYHAEEVINLFGLAIRYGITAQNLKHMLYAYPSSSSDITYMV